MDKFIKKQLNRDKDSFFAHISEVKGNALYDLKRGNSKLINVPISILPDRLMGSTEDFIEGDIVKCFNVENNLPVIIDSAPYTIGTTVVEWNSDPFVYKGWLQYAGNEFGSRYSGQVTNISGSELFSSTLSLSGQYSTLLDGDYYENTRQSNLIVIPRDDNDDLIVFCYTKSDIFSAYILGINGTTGVTEWEYQVDFRDDYDYYNVTSSTHGLSDFTQYTQSKFNLCYYDGKIYSSFVRGLYEKSKRYENDGYKENYLYSLINTYNHTSFDIGKNDGKWYIRFRISGKIDGEYRSDYVIYQNIYSIYPDLSYYPYHHFTEKIYFNDLPAHGEKLYFWLDSSGINYGPEYPSIEEYPLNNLYFGYVKIGYIYNNDSPTEWYGTYKSTSLENVNYNYFIKSVIVDTEGNLISNENKLLEESSISSPYYYYYMKDELPYKGPVKTILSKSMVNEYGVFLFLYYRLESPDSRYDDYNISKIIKISESNTITIKTFYEGLSGDYERGYYCKNKPVSSDTNIIIPLIFTEGSEQIPNSDSGIYSFNNSLVNNFSFYGDNNKSFKHICSYEGLIHNIICQIDDDNFEYFNLYSINNSGIENWNNQIISPSPLSGMYSTGVYGKKINGYMYPVVIGMYYTENDEVFLYSYCNQDPLNEELNWSIDIGILYNYTEIIITKNKIYLISLGDKVIKSIDKTTREIDSIVTLSSGWKITSYAIGRNKLYYTCYKRANPLLLKCII